MIAAETEKGERIEIAVKSLRANDRYSNGSFFTDEDETGPVTDVWRIPASDV